ncbi:MAG: AsmA family protein [Rickettsiales bacterium]|nr:AsmA family protein [Rickettsiales bacterium]
MKKFLKYSGLLLICCLVLLLIIPLFIPLDKYKVIASQKIKETIGRELEINGPMSLSLLPNPEIKLKDVKLSSVPGAKYPCLFEAKEVTASVSLFSLLTGNIVISEVEVNQPVINLEQLANGSTSWDFSKSVSPEANSNRESSKIEGKSELYIHSFKILEAKINYIKEINTGSELKVFEIDNLQIKNFRGPNNLTCEFYSINKDYNIKGDIKGNNETIALKASVNFLKEEIYLSGNFDPKTANFIGKLQLEGNAKNLKNFIPGLNIDDNVKHKVALNINADKKLVKVTNIDINFGELIAKGSSNYNIEKNEADLTLKLNPGDADIIFSTLARADKGLHTKIYIKAPALKPIISALKITAKDLPASIISQPFSFSTNLSYLDHQLLLRDINLTVDKANLSGSFSLRNWNKDLNVDYDINTNHLKTFSNLFAIDLPINISDLQIKGETTKIKDTFKTDNIIIAAKTTNIIKGDIILKDNIKPYLTLVSSGNNLGQTLGQLQKSTPNSGLGNYSLSAKVEGDFKKLIEVSLDKSTFSLNNTPLNINGLLSLNLSNVKPKILLNLKMSTLDLEGIINGNISSSPSNPNAKNEPSFNTSPWSKSKIDLSFFNKMDGDATITIQKVIKGELVFDSIKTVMKLTDGILHLKSLSGNLYGGHLEASGQVASEPSQAVSFKANLKGAHLKNMIHPGRRIKVTEGKVNFDTDLKTSGQTEYQYVSNLLGSAKLTAVNGKVSGFDLQKILNNLKNIKNLESFLKGLDYSFSGGETAFNQLEIDTNIKSGIANITKCNLDAPSVNMSATGSVKLPQYTIDVKSTINMDIKSMPPLKAHIYGALDNPQHKLDTKALQEHLIKNVLTNVIDNIRKNKKPEDILKGIIGGGTGNDEPTSQQPAGPQEPTPLEQKNPAKELESEVKKQLKGLFK